MARTKLSSKDFLAELAELSASLRRTIEAEDVGFDPSAAAIAERRGLVADPVTGFEYFVQHYFPHYVRHSARSELHNYLYKRLPEIIQATGSQNDAIAAPRGEAKSTIVSQLFVIWCIVLALKHYPPDGYHCRCRIRARTQADADRMGIEVKSWEQDIVTVQQAWGPKETRDVKALRFNGELYTPDAGFGHNPGQGWLSSLGQRLMDKSATTTPRIASQAIHETLSEPAVLDAVSDDVRRWVDTVSVRQKTRGDLRRVGGIQPELLNRLEERGVNGAITLSIHEEDVRLAPGPMWSELPVLLRQPAGVWLDDDALVWLLSGQNGIRAVRGVESDDGWRLSLMNAGATVTPGDVLSERAAQLLELKP